MNYYDARQRQTDKRWDYTCQNDGRVWPVGYCAGYHEPKDDGIVRWREDERQRVIANKDKYHRDGHATDEEARECYRLYLLDNDVQEMTFAEAQHPCVAPVGESKCNVWTQKALEIRHGGHYPLCDEHRNRETLEKLFEAPGQIMSSY